MKEVTFTFRYTGDAETWDEIREDAEQGKIKSVFIGKKEFVNSELIAELEAQLPKEGEWMFSRGDSKTCVDGWTCSACGNSFHTNVPYFEEYHYCPNCGAKMQTVTDCHTLEDGER